MLISRDQLLDALCHDDALVRNAILGMFGDDRDRGADDHPDSS